MARRAFKATLGASTDSQGRIAIQQSSTAMDPSVGLASATTDIAAAVLIGTGDASAPVLLTQADIAKASLDTGADVLVTINTATVTSVSKLQAALAAIVLTASGSGLAA